MPHAPTQSEDVAEYAKAASATPEGEYRRRLAEREDRVAALDARDRRIAAFRLAAFLLLLGVTWWWWRHRDFPWWCCLVPAAGFVALAVLHARVLRQRSLAGRAVAFYQKGLERLADRWAGQGQSKPRGDSEKSLFAADLDLFGASSLFALLSIARTRIGEDTLANWLLAPAPVPEVLERQEAVRELRGRIDLREETALLAPGSASDGSRGELREQELLAWAEAPPLALSPGLRWVAFGLAAAAVAGVVLWAAGGSKLLLLLTVLVEGTIAYTFRHRVEATLGAAQRAFAQLDLLAALLERLEREPVESPRLCALQAELLSAQKPASAAIARLRTLGMYIDSRDNWFVRILNIPLLYSLQLLYAAESWRRAHGSDVRRWLAATGEVEALLSLAGYSYEHPADPFPEFVEGAPCFEADGLGHPLLPAGRCVRNSVALGGQTQVLLISGSNMSGKSTLLRAVGLNAVLAMAGAPVRADRLRMTPLVVGASILVNDSLAEGSSRFYAEIQRLRAVCDQAGGSVPLLFLLDELLEGTNSRDRRVGAEGILRTLVARGAVGVTTTHDLALTEAAPDLAMRNMHFEDAVVDGRMLFDYRLREGVVTRSNGVALMRMVGLDV